MSNMTRSKEVIVPRYGGRHTEWCRAGQAEEVPEDFTGPIPCGCPNNGKTNMENWLGPTEVRVVDEKSGGAKGKKQEAFNLVPPQAMEEVARVYGKGAEKYAERNWERGYDWGLSLAALERHLNKFKAGEQRDELGNHHLACVVFHALALITFERFGLGTDTRSKLGQATQGSINMSNGFKIPVSWPSGEPQGLVGVSNLVDEEERVQRLERQREAPDYTDCRCGMAHPYREEQK